MREDFNSLLSQKIFVPPSAREIATDALPVSIRLWNVVRKLGCETLGDLHGESYEEIFHTKNCGRKTIVELKDFLAALASSDDDRQALIAFDAANKAAAENARRGETIYVPQESRGLPLSSFRFSTRLSNVLDLSGFRLLGDLHGVAYEQFKSLKNSGNKTVSELKEFIEKIQSGDFQIETPAQKIVLAPQELNLARFVRFVDEFVGEMPTREQNVLRLRFGAMPCAKPLTLEEVGAKYGITRERVRQIQSGKLKLLKARLGEAGEKLFDETARDCLDAVCPLAPQLLVFWTKIEKLDFNFSPAFYIRLLAEIAPEIPVLPEGQITENRFPKNRAPEILREIKSLLRGRFASVPLAEIFEKVKETVENLSAKEFLDAVRDGASLALTFDAPDKPEIKLTARRRAAEIANQILSESDRPLTPEEIIERAKEKFGDAAVTFSPFTLANMALYSEGFYLLDRRAIGLRKHFRLPAERWSEVRNDFFELLKTNNRSFSTNEVVARKLFDWTAAINPSETAQILYEDARFSDLGRFHFALAEWDVAEREMVTDLIVRVLERANRPLTSTEIGDEIQNFRSITPTSMSSILRQHKAVKDYGFGFYGLNEWTDARADFLTANKQFVNRAVARSEPPLTFGDLCLKLEIGESEKNLTEKLWRTLRSLPKIKFKPNERSPAAILVHAGWKFERAIQKVLSQAARPLSAYEIGWELKSVFGATFDDKNLDQIKNCLRANGDLFVGNAQGAYLLGEQIESSDATEENADWLRYACLEILTETGAVLSADDLLEKLAAEDLINENLSAQMLAAILRADGAFEEIGTNLFRAKK